MTLRYSMAAFAALACIGLGGNNASASTVCLNATHGATNYGPDTSCATSVESEMFLQSQTGTMKGFGNISSQTGLPLVEFTSTNALDLKNGNATITPAATGGKASFADLDITIPGHTFTDLIFDVQMLNAFSPTGETLTVSAWDGSTLERTFTYTTLAHDADIDFIVADASDLTAVDLSSPTGMKQAKHFDVSGVSGHSRDFNLEHDAARPCWSRIRGPARRAQGTCVFRRVDRLATLMQKRPPSGGLFLLAQRISRQGTGTVPPASPFLSIDAAPRSNPSSRDLARTVYRN